MEILEITDPEFVHYGKVVELDTGKLVEAMKRIPFEDGVSYLPSIPSLEAVEELKDRLYSSVYGGMPIQIGMCWGDNTRLNCHEYHRDSEINIGDEDFVLLLGRMDEIENGVFDTANVKAFHVPAGVAVEVYATTLHYAPCDYRKGCPFRVAVVLPEGTNTEKAAFEARTYEDRLMTARNKWLLAHEESTEARNGAVVALKGENIDIASIIA